MALLTNPNTGNGKFTKLLLINGNLICVCIYVLGIAWFLALAHRSFNNGTYFSENALLPGLVQGEFDEDISAKKFHLELKEVMQLEPNSIPYNWLFDKFVEMNLDVYFHNFTLHYPFGYNTTYGGKNVYAILRAPRSSSLESLIITAPYRTLNSAHPDNSASISIILALAKFCRRHMYWAKDIIFLITDHEQLGTQAWLEAYHNIQIGSGILKHGNLIGRAGSIQAAINLEFHSTKISHIDIKIEGLNGQLPNLDLVNLVHRLCKNEGVRHTFRNRNNPRKKDTALQQWYYSFTTLFSMVLTQASCVPNGNHGLYHRFGIEAVTLVGFEPPPNFKKQISGLYQIGRVLEGILRSLNNLLERFHQSYFFYLLPGNDRFIPIGSYMPSVSLIGLPLLVKGLTTWLKIYNHFKPKNEKKRQNQSVPEGLKTSCRPRFNRIGLILLISHFLGWLATNSGTWFSKKGFDFFGFSPKDSIYIGCFIFFFLSVANCHIFKINLVESSLLNIVGLLELATLLLIVAMHNFSLSFLLSVIYVPFVCLAPSLEGWCKKLWKSFAMLIVHPFVLIHLIVFGYSLMTQEEDTILTKAFFATQHFFVYLNIDEMIYGNWFIKVIFGFLMPNWILFWLCS